MFLIILCLFALHAPAEPKGESPSGQRVAPAAESSIREAILRELGDPHGRGVDAKALEYVSREADLNGDGRAEVLAWVPTTDYGGTGGYPLLIFRRRGQRLRLLAHIESVWTPLVVLHSSRHGWRDLVMQVGGGGEAMRYGVFRHNGKSYTRRFRTIREERIRGQQLIAPEWRMTPMGPIPEHVFQR